MVSLIKHCNKYHSDRTDADSNFATLLSIQSIGHLTGYNCYNDIGPDVVHHNSYLALLGPSTLSRKSTSQRLAKRIFPEDMCHPEEASPEQLIAELSEHPERMIWFPEFSSMLKCIGGKGNHYMSRIAELMNYIFDCPPTFTRKLRGRKGEDNVFSIVRPHLSFNTTCTEDMVLKYIDDEMVHGGFFARFIIAYGSEKDGMRQTITKEKIEHMEKLLKVMEGIQKLCPFTEEIVFSFDEDVKKRHHEIELEMHAYKGMGSFAGRYSNYIVSFADILFISDKLGHYIEYPERLNYLASLKSLFDLKDGKIYVPVEYVNQAWEVLKPCLEYTQKLVEAVGVSKPVAKLSRYMQKNPSSFYSDALRESNLNAEEMKLAVDTLERSGKMLVDTEINRSTTNREYKKIKLVWRGRYDN